MKNYIMILFLFITLLGCENFLSWESQDLVIPETVEQYNEIVAGELIKKSLPIDFLPYMTDEIEDGVSTGNGDSRGGYVGYYAFQKDPDITLDGSLGNNEVWSFMYNKIFICNMILGRIADGKIIGTENELKVLEAECRFFRAFYYFYMVNLYAPPYENEDQAKMMMGIPLNKETFMEDNIYRRNTLYEVYRYMLEDMEQCVEIFKYYTSSKLSIFHPSYVAATFLMGKLYLYMHDYENAEKYFDDALKNTTASLFDLNSGILTSISTPFICKKNTEILFSMGASLNYPLMNSGSNYFWKISDKLLNSYSSGDLRKEFFFYNSGVEPNKYSLFSDVYSRNFRLSELLLNKAECLIARESWQEAVEIVNEIRKKRFEMGIPYEVSARNKEEALEIVKQERFIELCFEDVRWFDLRRWGMPRLVHKFYTSPSTIHEFILEEESASYTLPIPKEITDENYVIERWERQEQSSILEL